MLFALLACAAAAPAGALTIAVDLDAATPDVEATREIAPGDEIAIAVRIFDVTAAAPLNAFELDLAYDAFVIEALALAAGDFLATPSFEVEAAIGPTEMAAAYATLGPAAASGDGILVLATLRGRAPGVGSITPNDVLLSSPFGEELPFDELFGAQLRVVPEPGTAFLLGLGAASLARRPRASRIARSRESPARPLSR